MDFLPDRNLYREYYSTFEWFSHYVTNNTGLLRTDPSLRVGMTT